MYGVSVPVCECVGVGRGGGGAHRGESSTGTRTRSPFYSAPCLRFYFDACGSGCACTHLHVCIRVCMCAACSRCVEGLAFILCSAPMRPLSCCAARTGAYKHPRWWRRGEGEREKPTDSDSATHARRCWIPAVPVLQPRTRPPHPPSALSHTHTHKHVDAAADGEATLATATEAAHFAFLRLLLGTSSMEL